jgi:putative glutamate/gamma-aminobutyrate antiporter
MTKLQSTQPGPGQAGNVRRALSWQTFAFLTLATGASIAQLPAAAEYGLGTITLYLIPAIFFLIPAAFVAAELAMVWNGGVFRWVSEGLGERAGFQAIWLQWIQSVALYPSLLSFAAASLAYAIGRPALANNGVYTGVVVLVIFWAATLIALRGLSIMARLSSLGTIVGTLVPALVLILMMVFWLGSGRTAEMPLKIKDIVPPFVGISSIVLIVSNFIAFAGLEVNAVHIREMRRPVNDYIKSMSVAVVLILLVYILGTMAISVAVPVKSIDLNAGAAQAFTAYAQGFGMAWLGVLMSALLLVGALAGSLSWVAGPSRGLLLVGQQGFLPRMFQRQNKAGVQAPIMLVQGVIVSVLSVLFVVIPGVSSAFWTLQAMTAILYMLMYILMFAAAWRLRITQPNVTRPFKVPAMPLVATVGALASAGAILIGLVPPSQFKESSPIVYAGLLIAGVLILAVPPQIIYRLRRPEWLDPAVAAAPKRSE